MKLQPINISILCLLFVASLISNVQAQDAEKTSCTNVDKKRWLVRKGVMTKDLCLSTKGDNLKVNIVGELFKLGSEYYDARKYTTEGTICPPKTDKPLKNPTPEMSWGTYTKKTQSKFSLFRKFLIKLHSELTVRNNKKKKSNPSAALTPEELKFDITSTGYADGVRNLRTVLDKEILHILGKAESEDYKEIYKYVTQEKVNAYNTMLGSAGAQHKISFPISPEDYRKIACHPDLGTTSGAVYAKVPKYIFKNFLTPMRNVVLAKNRASTLVNGIFTKDQLKVYSKNKVIERGKYALQSKIKIANNPKIQNGGKACYGYCEGHRGAKLDIKIPTLKEVVKIEKKETIAFPIAFNTPSSAKQITFNKMAIKQFFNDVTKSALKDDKGTGFKSFLNKISEQNPTITIDNKKHSFDMEFPITKLGKIEERFIPDFTQITTTENPFKASSTNQKKINKALFTYLSRNYKKGDVLKYTNQDRKFITKYLAQRFKTSEAKIKAQKDLLNWAIIFYWSRFGTSVVKDRKLSVNETADKTRPYIDSEYSADLNTPADQKLIKLYTLALKHQTLFFNNFHKEVSTLAGMHSRSNILGKLLKEITSSNTNETKRKGLAPLYKRYVDSQYKGYGKTLQSMASAIIQRYYPKKTIIMYTKKNDRTIIRPKTPMSILAYVNLILDNPALGSSDRFIINPAEVLSPENLKVFNFVFKDPSFQSNIFKETTFKSGSITIAALNYLWSAASITRIHANASKESCKTRIFYRSKSSYSKDIGNYTSSSKYAKCTFLRDIVAANDVKSMEKVLDKAYAQPPTNSVMFSSSNYYNKPAYNAVYFYSPISSNSSYKAYYNIMKKYYAQYMLNLKKTIEASHGKMVMTSSEVIVTSTYIDKIDKVLTTKQTAASVQGGNDSTVFSFLDYDSAYSAHYKGAYTDTSKFLALPMNSPVDIDSIYYTPASITSGEDGMKGFYHNACRTGVMFQMKVGQTKFKYQSRLKVRSSYYSSSSGADGKSVVMKAFDDTYKIGFDSTLSKYDYFNIIRLKHPTAYLLNDCPNKCGCLAELKSGKSLKTIINEKLVRYKSDKGTRPAIMNFSQGYTWETTKNKKARPIKRFMLKTLIGKNISADESKKYCVVTPLVPQTHYVGSGSAKETAFKPPATKNDNIIPQPCPVISVLAKNFPTDYVKDVDKQDEIIRFCKNVSDNFPFDSENECLGKKNNNACSYLDKATRDKFPSLCGSKYGTGLWSEIASKGVCDKL